ncbi:hypothetical protein ACFQ0M_11110 [Kitasatospora aburaviensis]
MTETPETPPGLNSVPASRPWPPGCATGTSGSSSPSCPAPTAAWPSPGGR